LQAYYYRSEAIMKKAILVVLVVLVVSTVGYAEWRSDIGMAVPWKLGATLTGALGETESLNVLSRFTFLIPQVFLGYEFGLGPVNLGVGGRLYTLILESVAIPAVFAEVALGPVALNLNVAGGGYLLFGLYNAFETPPLILPDLSAHFKLGKSLHLGVGATGILHPELQAEVIPYVLYLSGRFIIRF
jgi:hypothetical protein